jgi:putative FmdB family regulatory protein
MPTYDYECDACQHAFEAFHAMSEAPIKKCPKCKKMKVRRLIGSGGAVIFKGAGFYTTDYRSDSYKSAAKSDTPSGECSGTPASCTKKGCGPAPDA